MTRIGSVINYPRVIGDRSEVKIKTTTSVKTPGVWIVFDIVSVLNNNSIVLYVNL